MTSASNAAATAKGMVELRSIVYSRGRGKKLAAWSEVLEMLEDKLLFLTFKRVGCQPERTTLHGGQSCSWSAKQGKENQRESGSSSSTPPPPPRCLYEGNNNNNNKTRRVQRRELKSR